MKSTSGNYELNYKDKSVAEWLLWNFRRRPFRWEKELVVCNEVVLGVDFMEGEVDRWQWEGGLSCNLVFKYFDSFESKKCNDF